MSHPPSDHFKGNSIVDHLKEARTRGQMAAQEVHGTEMPGHIAACADAAKETAVVLLLLWQLTVYFYPIPQERALLFLFIFCVGWGIWKAGRSALLGWARMERLHRLIEEERLEIKHHRNQERSELTEMYRVKGFSGKLLEEVIDVLMADDNRLLRVMLEEELGLTLEAYEHPLLQSIGALCGVAIASSFCIFGFWAAPVYGLPLSAAVVLSIGSLVTSVLEHNRLVHSLLWNLSIFALLSGAAYFIIQLLGAS